jgi:hypothetical protein
VPNELSELVKFRSVDLKQTITAYVATRVKHWTVLIGNFISEFATDDERKQEARRAVSLMELRVPISQIRTTYLLNEQLMYEDNDHVIRPITPLAQDALLAHWGNTIKEDLYQAIGAILHDLYGHWSRDSIGRATEKYITMCIEESKKFCFSMVKIDTKSPVDDWYKFTVDIPELTIVHYTNLSRLAVPSMDKSILFLPTASNHPAVDLAVWDAECKTLYAIQITILPVNKHKHNFYPKQKQSWTNALKKWSSAEAEIWFVWISPLCQVDKAYNGEYFVDLFSLPSNFFPLLEQCSARLSLVSANIVCFGVVTNSLHPRNALSSVPPMPLFMKMKNPARNSPASQIMIKMMSLIQTLGADIDGFNLLNHPIYLICKLKFTIKP